MTKQIIKGNYKVNIRKNADGTFFVFLTNRGQCVPGIPGKHYTSLKRAEQGARIMLAHV
tara:strand:+ start:15250 stop:15426 length:177 start_codon:yes stop_codon:yes gene_type:complete